MDRLLSICIMFLLATSAVSACPFADRKLLKGGTRIPPGRALPCNLISLLQHPPYVPPGPTTQTTTDATVKSTVYRFLLSVMTTRDGRLVPNAPIGGFLRSAFHDAGTFNLRNKTGGANGSLRNELGLPADRGLAPAVNQLVRWRGAINRLLPAGVTLSMADLFQLAGAVAVEVSGGPKSLFPSVPVGRVDFNGRDSTSELPEMMALSGAHTIGFKHLGGRPRGQNKGPPPTIPLDIGSPLVFDTSIYGEMQTGKATLRSDNALGAGNPTAVAQYLGNQTAFFDDFSAAYVKMGKMGARWKSYGP